MSTNDNSSITTLKKLRQLTLKITADLSPEQLNRIPEGFNNNIIWNLAHLLAAQQNLTYVRAGQTPLVSMEFINSYKAGTKPEHTLSEAEINQIRELLDSSISELETALNSGLLDNYQGLTNSLGIDLNTIQEAISYLPVHEGLHLGYILALKRTQK